MDDDHKKENLPVHITLGANDFAKIHTSECLRLGRRGDPVAEFRQFGWTIISPGNDKDLRKNAETTKLRVVYDASAHTNGNALSLND